MPTAIAVAMLTFAASGALALHMPLAPGPPRSRPIHMQIKANSWQGRLDKALLDVDVAPQARFRLLQRALKDPQLKDDVASAVSAIQERGFGKGHPDAIEALWPAGTIARSDIEALAALRTQVPEALKAVQQAARAPSARSPAPPSVDPAEIISAVVGLATDREQQAAIEEEIKNIARSTPKGLETPAYTVEGAISGPEVLGRAQTIELRSYAPFTVARTTMANDVGDVMSGAPGAKGAKGFNTLASYLFGKNAESTKMEMTMPVEIASTAAGDSSMSFVLPRGDGAAAPTPLDESEISIEDVPARLVAVKAFPGLVTDEEVERQRKELLAAVDVRPVLLEVGSDARMKAKTLSLRLPHEDARFVLRAESPKDRDAWLRAIAEVQVEAKRDSSATWADSDSLKIVAGGAEGAKADALLAAARARGRADLESPRASEARASTFDGRHVSSLTAASVVPVASSCDTSLLTSVATAPAGRASAAEAAAAEPIDLRDSLSRERSYSAKTADGKAPPAAPATPPPTALGPPCLSFFGC